jgi:hypothetical protein
MITESKEQIAPKKDNSADLAVACEQAQLAAAVAAEAAEAAASKAKKLSEEALEAAAAAVKTKKIADAATAEAARARLLLEAAEEKEEEDAAARAKISMVAKKRKSRTGSYVMFPRNLHDLLDNGENLGYERTISWMPDGKGFRIHEPWNMDHIIKTFFNQNKFKSFLRQLQNYGFARVLRGRERGICKHPLFVRGQRDLSEQMKRIIHLKNTSNLSPSSFAPPDDTPSSPALPSQTPPSPSVTSTNAAKIHRLRQHLQQQKSEDDQEKPSDEPEEETPGDPFEHELSFLAYLCELQTPINNSPQTNKRGGFPGPASRGGFPGPASRQAPKNT